MIKNEIVAAPKHFQTSNDLSPNFFRESGEEFSPYSFAIYKEKKLGSHSSKYAFATKLDDSQIPPDEVTRISRGDYDELWFKGGNQKLIVIAKKKDSLIESITLSI